MQEQLPYACQNPHKHHNQSIKEPKDSLEKVEKST